MNDFRRLHEEPESELEHSLLNAGRTYSASASTRAKTLAAIGVMGATVSSTTAAATVSKAGIVKWLVATALLVGAAVPALRYMRPPAASPPAVSTTTKPATALTASATETTASTAEPANAPVTSAEATSDPAPSAVPTSAAKPSANAPGLSAELAALDIARSALANGDPTGALSNLDTYARSFPHGKLRLEAEVLRIDALAKSGQTAAAQKRAQAFIKRHPDSVLASRVRAYAGQ